MEEAHVSWARVSGSQVCSGPPRTGDQITKHFVALLSSYSLPPLALFAPPRFLQGSPLLLFSLPHLPHHPSCNLDPTPSLLASPLLASQPGLPGPTFYCMS